MKEFTVPKVLLASGSPRRRQLLADAGYDVVTVTSREVEESYPFSLDAEDVAEYLSKLKFDAYADMAGKDGRILLTADTVVVVDGKVLGKPADAREAKKMLRSLSGRTHHVITGVTLGDGVSTRSFSITTQVHFDMLTDAQIDYYIAIYKPFDKAGAYGIQEWIGLVGIKGIDGCFYNVMGLPVNAIDRAIAEIRKSI